MNKPKTLVLFFILIVILIWTIGLNLQNRKSEERKKSIESIDVQFTGSVVSKKEIKRLGRIKIIICVDLSYSNIQSYFLLDKRNDLFCNIDNNIASFVIPKEYARVDSVSINMNGGNLQRYYYKGELLVKYPLSFSYTYLTKEDLEWCFK